MFIDDAKVGTPQNNNGSRFVFEGLNCNMDFTQRV